MLLSAASITKAFAGVRALKGVSFELRPGEVHALVGENGAGKSTLIKIITGAEVPDRGELVVHGRVVAEMDPGLSRALGIAAIYQQPSLFPDLTVAENIAMALETGGPWRRLDWTGRTRTAAALLERIGASIDPARLVETLSMPEQQIVEIAKAIGADAKIVIMDEPTASLTEREVERLFKVIALLKAHGCGIIYISHRLEEVFAVADRITVLRDGETVKTCARGDVDRAALIRMMVGRELSAVFPKRAVPLGDVALDVRHLSHRATGVADVSLTVRKGEILGLAGLVGLRPHAAGGDPLRPHARGCGRDSGAREDAAPVLARRRDRRRNRATCQRIAGSTASCSRCRSRRTRAWPASARCRAADSSTAPASRPRPNTTSSASASRRRRSAPTSGRCPAATSRRSRWPAGCRPTRAILILDEPTQGVDVGSKAEIHSLMQTLAEQGLAIIMISSELPEILGMSDRIAVMHAGRIRGVLDRADATQASVLALALHE